MGIFRNILVWMLILSAFTLLVFGPRPELRKGESGVVTIEYWEKWGGLEATQMQSIIDEFNQTAGKEKGIFVRYLSVSSVNQKTLVATAANVPPDVAGMWDGNIPQFGALGALAPLDELAAGYGITEEYYKPVYWEGCRYDGKLYGLVSTPAAVALHWNKIVFEEAAENLRAAGLDPDLAPRTLDELDAYAAALDVISDDGWVERAGYVPVQPGFWWTHFMPFWFGGELYDEANRRLCLDIPEAVAAYEWVRSYSVKFGVKSITEFRSSQQGAGTISTVEPFIVGTLAMEQQGPWRANYFNVLAPHLNEWKMPREEAERLPIEERRKNYAWGAAPFPSADGRELVCYAGFDVLTIPSASRHKREAFDFIAFVNRRDVMERLCSMHSKNSPLRDVSEEFIENHPNPYVQVFEDLSSSPHARGLPRVPIWAEVQAELSTIAQEIFLLKSEPEEALARVQKRMQAKLDRFFEIDDRRRKSERAGPS
jgi:ABC-type glycerol-3-phosphate transport system substrate-binding protein